MKFVDIIHQKYIKKNKSLEVKNEEVLQIKFMTIQKFINIQI